MYRPFKFFCESVATTAETYAAGLIRPDENGEKEFVVGLVGYDKDKILCQKLDEDMNGVENVEFKLADCAYVKLNDDADLF